MMCGGGRGAVVVVAGALAGVEVAVRFVVVVLGALGAAPHAAAPSTTDITMTPTRAAVEGLGRHARVLGSIVMGEPGQGVGCNGSLGGDSNP
jgi:hypothetical protein